jgi:monoamine oxidase
MREEIVIIGGGIAGLTAAYQLNKQGLKALLLESNDRLGGRIYTKTNKGKQFELGATWVFQDPMLKQLINELGLSLYPQYLGGDALIKYQPSMPIQRSPTAALMGGAIYHKVEGGTGAIIQALADQLDADRILLNKKVTALAFENGSITLTIADGSTVEAAKVIIAVPPKAIAHHIHFSPPLSSQHLLDATHTWMGESAKFTVLLDRDYWRMHNLSGFVYSNYGLIREMQDHIAPGAQSFGLLGFMNPVGEWIRHFEKRKEAVTRELKELFGVKEEHILAYDDFLWREYFIDDDLKNYNHDMVPHQNNGHPFYQQAHFNNHLFFAGAETSLTNPGYMEGAVGSAHHAVSLLLNQLV